MNHPAILILDESIWYAVPTRIAPAKKPASDADSNAAGDKWFFQESPQPKGQRD
jgi:hypothetical protein